MEAFESKLGCLCQTFHLPCIGGFPPEPSTTARCSRDNTSGIVSIQMVYVQKGDSRTLHAVHLVEGFKYSYLAQSGAC